MANSTPPILFTFDPANAPVKQIPAAVQAVLDAIKK